MKKFLALMLVVLATFSLASCKKDDKVRTYKADGKYTAFSLEKHSNGAPQMTTVTVTIKNDKLVDVEIDCLQGVGTAFNEKTKKELGYEYKMHYRAYTESLAEGTEGTMEGYKAWLKANNKLDWFEQAKLIEDAMVKNGVDSVAVTDKYISNVTGVTIKDGGYTTLAKEAIANAKAGKVITVEAGDNYGKAQVVWAEATVDANSKLSNVKIDTMQSSKDAEGNFQWNAKSKQELGYEYKMHYRAYTESLAEGTEGTMEGYKAWLKANNKLEWFEQVALVVTAWTGAGVTVDEAGHTNVTGVTITVNHYKAVLDALVVCVFTK